MHGSGQYDVLVSVGDEGFSDLELPALRSGRFGGKISTESLILAQDERWRRA